ncbi:MAG: EF-hand domain-containing protein [Candidatus Sericytochromatia bacterium]
MKRALFALTTLTTLGIALTACQAGPRPLGATIPMMRASAPQLVRSASAPRGGSQGLEDFRNYLAGKLFENLDQNRDQAVTQQEFSRLLDKAVVARFAELDAGRDGRLSPAEFALLKNQIFSPRYSEATLRDKLTAFFQTQDLDKDQFVSWAECKGNLNLLFDYDHDNRFALNEFLDATSQLLQLAPAKTEEFLKAHLG